MAQQGGRLAANYVVMLVLALMLAPRDFGVVSLAVSWVAFMTVFCELGFSAALIQRTRITEGHLSTTFALNVGLGSMLTALGVLLSWPLADFFRIPGAQPVFAVLSAGFLINAFSITQVALAQRELRFRDLAIRDTVAATVGGVVGIAVAYMGWGIWALVTQTLVTMVSATVLLWRLSEWRPRADQISLDAAQQLWGYGSRIFAFNILKYFAQNGDKLLIGYLTNPGVLGGYTVAYRLVVYPVATFTGAIGNYLFPRLSQLKDDFDVARTLYLDVTRTTNTLLLPIMAACATLAPLLVPVTLGAKWIEIVPLIQLFALVAVVQTWLSPLGQLMKAMDRPGWMLRWSMFFTVLTLASIAIGSAWGVLGIGLSVAAAHMVGLCVGCVLARRLLGIGWRALTRASVPGLLLAGAVAGMLHVVMRLEFASDAFRLLACGVTVIVTYCLALPWVDRTLWKDLTAAIRKT